MNENVHSCKQLVATISEYVDGTLDDALCIELEQHLMDCEDCQIVVDTLRRTIELYHSTSPAVNIPDEVRKRLYACLNLEEYLKK